MLDALLLSTALLVPSDHPPAENGKRVVVSVVDERAKSKWLDSGRISVWEGVPEWIRSLGKCIRQHESHHNPNAENRISSASGAYQYLDGTWRGVAKWVKVDGKYVARQYSRASHAPFWVQDAAFIHTIKHGGIKAWHGTWCPGT